jgi:hypothetical protein
MKVLYRPQRSTLEDAMAEVKEFESLKEMCAYLVRRHERAFDISDIYISYYCYDKRIDWENYIVTIGKYGGEDYIKKYHCPQAIGFCTIKKERNNNEN